MEIKPSDIIWANRIVKGLPYNHCGVYIGDGKVIHFAASTGSKSSMKTKQGGMICQKM
jgi:cell wall-associated NlpC family hydrolase